MSRFFLFIGSTKLDAALNKLKAAGILYRQKRLESGPPNWQTIIELAEDPALIGAVVKITGENYRTLLDPEYAEVALTLLRALGRTRHVAFVHETVLSGAEESPESEVVSIFDDEEFDSYHYFVNHYFAPPPDDVRLPVNQLLEENGIHIVPYRSNAEMSVLSAAFIDDNEKNLLFRLYVPNGRIYAGEADKLLSMFRDWLTQVKRQRVRQGGYRTGSGQVFEFFGDDAVTSSELTTEFDVFSRFVELCVDDPDVAREQLSAAGVEDATADDIVRRYGKETRRLHLDLKHARESRLLAIRQRLESELVEVLDNDSPEWGEINRLIDAAVPETSNVVGVLSPGGGSSAPPSTRVTINQQIINSVQGNVLQGLQGTVHFGPQTQELFELVTRFGGPEISVMQSAIHELEDGDARHADRLRAKQRLKGFLIKLGGKVEDATLKVLQAYIEKTLTT